ncbi:HipA protein [Salinispira pacifica]|uniref:HipA protein n=1 Tax=Salinispira pacifica TaxID=1307761 RepID=V5WMP8_9SPIO|nr:HipA protein [Salinispira pacifica]
MEPGIQDRHFFSNLLPKGIVRRELEHSKKIHHGDDFALLADIGRDCAGALSITDTPEPPIAEQAWYQEIGEQAIRDVIASKGYYLPFTGETPVRLSLAGAQHKWAVYRDQIGTLHWPHGSGVSSHIIKFPHSAVNNLPLNEAFCTRFLGDLELPVITTTAYNDYVLSSRYDRKTLADGTIARVHQEDFLQASGYSSHEKYGISGGIQLSEIAKILRSHSYRPVHDINVLLQRQLANIITGNTDAHGKNLSILYTASGPTLSPLYDLTSTLLFGKLLDQRYAFPISPDETRKVPNTQDIAFIARSLGVRPALVMEQSEKLTQLAINRMTDSVISFYEQHQFVKKRGMVSNLANAILRWVKAIRKSLHLESIRIPRIDDSHTREDRGCK